MNVPTMWDPSATHEPSAALPAKAAVEQLRLMASVVLALLSEPFCEYLLPSSNTMGLKENCS